jgi:hypothetical protein
MKLWGSAMQVYRYLIVLASDNDNQPSICFLSFSPLPGMLFDICSDLPLDNDLIVPSCGCGEGKQE